MKLLDQFLLSGHLRKLAKLKKNQDVLDVVIKIKLLLQHKKKSTFVDFF